MTWVRFQKHYLLEYPAAGNVVAVGLDEGSIVFSNSTKDPAGDGFSGRRVMLKIVRMDGGFLPRFELEGRA